MDIKYEEFVQENPDGDDEKDLSDKKSSLNDIEIKEEEKGWESL
jgi:hypothetical protein